MVVVVVAVCSRVRVLAAMLNGVCVSVINEGPIFLAVLVVAIVGVAVVTPVGVAVVVMFAVSVSSVSSVPSVPSVAVPMIVPMTVAMVIPVAVAMVIAMCMAMTSRVVSLFVMVVLVLKLVFCRIRREINLGRFACDGVKHKVVAILQQSYVVFSFNELHQTH